MAKRLLVIDDDQTIREVLFEAYSEDYIIKTSPSPENLFALLDEFKPDLILIEYKLRRKNGAILCSSIKLNLFTAHIPVIILSTISKPNMEIKNCFCDNFVGKPFDLWKLEDTIKQYCPV